MKTFLLACALLYRMVTRVGALESPDLQAPSRYIEHIYVRPLENFYGPMTLKLWSFLAKVRPQPLNLQQIFSKILKSFTSSDFFVF